jgi:hypothetical protein
MIVRSFELQRSEDALEDLGAPASVTCQPTAGTRKMRLVAIGVIGIEPLLDGVGR